MRNIIVEIKTYKEFPLEKEMKKRNLSIREIAQKSGVHYTFISRLLSNKSNASTIVYNKLRDALEMSLTPNTKQQ